MLNIPANGPELIPSGWPHVWQSLLKSPAVGTDAKRVSGARVTVAKGTGALQYTCPCGAGFTRHEGDFVREMQDWVKEHKPHLPEEEQADVSP